MLKQLIFVFSLCLGHMADAQCNINICGMVLDSPLLIKVGTNQFYEPNNKKGAPPNIFLKQNEEIELHCVHNFENFNVKQIKIKCFNNNNYQVIQPVSGPHAFSHFKCSQNNIADVENLSTPPGPKIKIGYNTGTHTFITLMEVYHDDASFSNLWVSSSIDEFRCPRANLDKINPKNIIYSYQNPKKFNIYKKTKVDSLINGLLGTHNYFLNGNFINKGHLSASSDYSHIAKQAATFSFYNIMPQWEKFNSGNWNSIEQDIRKLVDAGLNIHVITGVLGNLNLKGSMSSQQIFLDDKAKQIPIRKYFYKIVIDKSMLGSLAIVGNNDPQDPTILCTKPVTTSIKWLTNQADYSDKEKGVLFACKVRDFLNNAEAGMGAVAYKALKEEIAKFDISLMDILLS